MRKITYILILALSFFSLITTIYAMNSELENNSYKKTNSANINEIIPIIDGLFLRNVSEQFSWNETPAEEINNIVLNKIESIYTAYYTSEPNSKYPTVVLEIIIPKDMSYYSNISDTKHSYNNIKIEDTEIKFWEISWDEMYIPFMEMFQSLNLTEEEFDDLINRTEECHLPYNGIWKEKNIIFGVRAKTEENLIHTIKTTIQKYS